LQDDERRRIARGLHDSLGQYLAALKMQLGLMSMSNGDQASLIADSSEIVDRCITETRTISHLLHSLASAWCTSRLTGQHQFCPSDNGKGKVAPLRVCYSKPEQLHSWG
jgi:nitrate/nitrite-specific signal transduction histidine kinase